MWTGGRGVERGETRGSAALVCRSREIGNLLIVVFDTPNIEHESDD